LNIDHVKEAIIQSERNQVEGYYLATGPFRRNLYPKHIDFFHAGASHRERLFPSALSAQNPSALTTFWGPEKFVRSRGLSCNLWVRECSFADFYQPTA